MKKLLFILIVCCVSCQSEEDKQRQINRLINNSNFISESNVDSALIFVNQALELDPLNFTAHNYKQRFLISSGRIDEAIEETIILDGMLAVPDYFILGMLYEISGDTTKAKELYGNLSILNTKIIDNSNNQDDVKYSYYERAKAKKFLGDESYIDDLRMATNGKEWLYESYRQELIVKSKDEIIEDIIGYKSPSKKEKEKR